MGKARGIQGKWRESNMEYTQELESLKNEINKSGERIESLSENFSELGELQEVIKGFREDIAFSRIESKIDIIAQADSTEIMSLIIGELNDDINEKLNEFSDKINSLEQINSQLVNYIENGGIQGSSTPVQAVEINEIKENVNLISSNYKNFLENLNEIQNAITNLNNGENFDIEGFTREVRASIANMQQENISGAEENILNKIAELDRKINNIKLAVPEFDDINCKFSVICRKMDSITEVLKHTVLENPNEFPGLSSMESQVDTEISGNLNSLKEYIYGLHEEMNKVSLLVQENESNKNLSEKVDSLMNLVEELKGSTDSVDTTQNLEEFLGRVSQLQDNLISLQENLPESNVYTEIKEGFTALSGRILEVYENLYPLQNLQTVTESFQSVQDKLNIILEHQNINDVNAIKDTLDLDGKFNDVHAHIDTKITYNLDSLNNKLDEILERTTQINSGTNNDSLTNEYINSAVNELGIDTENLKELLDRIIKLNCNNNELLENNFEEVKNTLSYINQEIISLKESNGDTSIEENFRNAQEKLDILVNFTKGQVSGGLQTNLSEGFNYQIDPQIVDNIDSIKECLVELNQGQNDTEEIKNAVNFLRGGLEEITQNLKYSKENNISDDLLKSLLEEIGSIRDLTSSSSKLNEINARITDLDKKISSLQEVSQFNEGIEYIKEHLYGLEEKFNYITERTAEFTEYSSSIEEEDFTAVDYQLQSLNEDLEEKISNNTEILNRFLHEFSGKIESIDSREAEGSLNEKISALSSSFSGVSEQISDLCEKIYSLGNIQEKLEEINSQKEFASDNEEIINLNNKIDQLTDEVRAYRESLPTDQEYMSEIKKSFYSLNEEIKSFDDGISDLQSKMNKLIINSNDSTEILKGKVNESLKYFQNELSKKLDSNSNKFIGTNKARFSELSQELGGIAQKIDKLNNLSARGLSTSDMLREAIIQMAEWIDSAGVLLEANNETSKQSLSKLENVEQAVSVSERNLSDMLDRVYNKFENFEIRLESIEARIERMANINK